MRFVTKKTKNQTFENQAYRVFLALGISFWLILGAQKISNAKRAGAESPVPPGSEFAEALNTFECPSEASCSQYNPGQARRDCVAYGYLIAKVVDITSNSEVEVTSRYLSENRLRIETQHNPSTLWRVREDSGVDSLLNCQAVRDQGFEVAGAYFGSSSCSPLTANDPTLSDGVPTATNKLWCFNGNFDVRLLSLPEGFELADIVIEQNMSGQAGTVDLAGMKITGANICNYSWGPGNYIQQTHKYKFKVRERPPERQRPVCAIKTVPSPAEGEAPLAVFFDGRDSYDPDGRVVRYAWAITDGYTSAESNFNHTFTQAGNYRASLIVEDNDGLLSDLCSVAITARERPPERRPPVCEATANPTSGDAPLTVQFDGSGSYDPDGTIVEYSWNFGDSTTGSGVRPTHTYNSAGSFDALLRVKDNDGLWSEQCHKTITVTRRPERRPPVCEARADPTSGEAPLTVQFDGSGSSDPDGSIVEYSWNFGDGTSGSGVRPTHTYNNPGTYDAILRVKDNDGLWSDQCHISISVSRRPPPPEPQFSQEPWVKHFPKGINVYVKKISVVSGGPVEDWEVSGALSILSQSGTQITVEARSGQCPTFRARIGSAWFGPFDLGCVPEG